MILELCRGVIIYIIETLHFVLPNGMLSLQLNIPEFLRFTTYLRYLVGTGAGRKDLDAFLNVGCGDQN